MNENTTKSKIANILGLILTAIPSFVPTIQLIIAYWQTIHSNASDDARGWGFLFLMVITIGILPAIGTMFLPFIIFIVHIVKKRIQKTGWILILISNGFFALELLFFRIIAGEFNTDFSIYDIVFYLMLFIILSIIDIYLLRPKNK